LKHTLRHAGLRPASRQIGRHDTIASMHDHPAAGRSRSAWGRVWPALMKGLFVAALCAQMAGCAVVDYEQRRWIFMPTTSSWGPGAAAAVGMQDVWIEYAHSQASDPADPGEPAFGPPPPTRLHGLWLARPEADAPVLLFLHGTRWDVRASAKRMRQLHALGFSVLGVDYRGFGRSSAALPSEDRVAEDARAAWAWLARTHPQARRYVYGHSLGAAVAVRLAQEVPDEAGLVVEGAFTSVVGVLNSTRWGWLPIQWMITQQFDAASRIAQVGSPVLVVHGGDDSMVSPSLGRELYELARPPKRFLLVEGAVHENTDVVGHEQVRQAMQELFGLRARP
jgi:hypothetical protein